MWCCNLILQCAKCCAVVLISSLVGAACDAASFYLIVCGSVSQCYVEVCPQCEL